MNKITFLLLLTIPSLSFAGGSIGGLGGGGASRIREVSKLSMPSLEERFVRFDDFKNIVMSTLSKETILLDEAEYTAIELNIEEQKVELQPTKAGSNILVKPQDSSGAE